MPQLAGGKLGLVVKSLVVAAVADTKALELGFLPGDRILAVNDNPVGSTPEFYREVSRAMADNQARGAPVVFDLWRKKDTGSASTGSPIATTSEQGTFRTGSFSFSPGASPGGYESPAQAMVPQPPRGAAGGSPPGGSFALASPGGLGGLRPHSSPRGAMPDTGLPLTPQTQEWPPPPPTQSSLHPSVFMRTTCAARDTVPYLREEQTDAHSAAAESKKPKGVRRRKDLCPELCNPANAFSGDPGPAAAANEDLAGALRSPSPKPQAPTRRRKFVC